MSASTPLDTIGRFHQDPERSYTLPASYAYDPAVFAAEKEAIFYRSWQYAGHGEQVAKPGDYVVRTVGEESIAIVRGSDGTLRAFYNVCVHRAHQLLEGGGNVKRIVCPYHAWTYETDGRLKYARNSEHVRGFQVSDSCLTPVQVEEFLGFLFVNLDPHAPALSSQTHGLEEEVRRFSPRLAELTLSHRRGYDVKANWKNIVENYSECYHCPKSHPSFVRDVVDINSYSIEVHDIYHSHRGVAKPPEEAAYEFDANATEHAQEFGGWFLWPNVSIEVYPGGCLNVFHVVPVEPERSMLYIEWYFYDKQPTKEQSEVIEYLHETVRLEDQVICESVQRGLRSRGYQDGRFVVDNARSDASEHAVHHFQHMVKKALHA